MMPEMTFLFPYMGTFDIQLNSHFLSRLSINLDSNTLIFPFSEFLQYHLHYTI